MRNTYDVPCDCVLRSRSWINYIQSAGLLLFCAAASLWILASQAIGAVTGSTKFIPAALIYYGGGAQLNDGDASRLAKFDLIDIDRFRYLQVDNGTWRSIKARNPATEIYLYEMGAESANYLDGADQMSINSLARYNISRGHPMGSLNGDHPEFFLLDGNGNRIYSLAYSNPGANRLMNLMDFGSSDFQSYWVTAVRADITDQPWRADGVYADVCVNTAAGGGYNATSAKYPNDAAWSAAMNSFSSGIAGGLHGVGQKLWCNKGDSRTNAGSAAWRALDASADHPDVLLEEGAFAVGWGADVQFYPEPEWKNQVDVLGSITNTKVAYVSHTQLSPGGWGTDSWGRSVGFWQTFYYALASMLMGKNAQLNNAYLMFNQGSNFNYNSILWFDEYDAINLGRPMGSYQVSPTSGVNIYWREYERGYVAVNPTASDVSWFSFPQSVRPITHDNLLNQDSIGAVSGVALQGHSAAIVLKTSATDIGGDTDVTTGVPNGGNNATPPPTITPPVTPPTTPTAPPVTGGDTTPPSPPSGLAAIGISSSRVDLSWGAAADNVGVAGYRVYRDNALVANPGPVLAWQDWSLSSNSTYRYSVTAVDAAGNESAAAVIEVATIENSVEEPPPAAAAGQ